MVARTYNQQDRTAVPRPAQPIQPVIDRDRLIIREVAIKEAASIAMTLVMSDELIRHPQLQPYQVIINLTAVLTDAFAEIIQGTYKPDAIVKEG